MCDMGAMGAMPSTVAAAAGGGAPGKVAAANGSATQTGTTTQTATQAGTGAALLGGGGGDLASVLAGLSAAIKSLADLVSKMNVSGGGGKAGGCDMPGMGNGVMGVQGTAATTAQYVAPVQVRAVAASNATGEDDAFEQEVLTLINKERAKAGLAGVTYNPMLDNAAEKHASHMGIVRKMAHDGIGDGDPGERIRAEGFGKSWGENVAVGQTSAAQVVAEWMASPGHRRNILDPNYKQMGVGLVTGSDGRNYWAQEFGA